MFFILPQKITFMKVLFLLSVARENPTPPVNYRIILAGFLECSGYISQELLGFIEFFF